MVIEPAFGSFGSVAKSCWKIKWTGCVAVCTCSPAATWAAASPLRTEAPPPSLAHVCGTEEVMVSHEGTPSLPGNPANSPQTLTQPKQWMKPLLHSVHTYTHENNFSNSITPHTLTRNRLGEGEETNRRTEKIHWEKERNETVERGRAAAAVELISGKINSRTKRTKRSHRRKGVRKQTEAWKSTEKRNLTNTNSEKREMKRKLKKQFFVYFVFKKNIEINKMKW